MSVVVKGMKMPDHCWECWLMRNLTCGASGELIPSTGKRKHCPLAALPDKHGDLIDRQKLIEDNKHLEYPTDGKYRGDRAWAVGFNAGARHCNEHAVYAKTVIEAEDNE